MTLHVMYFIFRMESTGMCPLFPFSLYQSIKLFQIAKGDASSTLHEITAYMYSFISLEMMGVIM